MGLQFQQHDVTRAQTTLFERRLHEQLAQIESELEKPCYNRSEVSFGAELEMYLIDRHFMPAALNEAVLGKARVTGLQEELNQYNIEYNLDPVDARGTPFTHLKRQLSQGTRAIDQTASLYDGHAVAIGILPTLSNRHLTLDFLTNRPRYKALTSALKGLNKGPFQIDIHGQDTVRAQCEEVTLEGANTSFQFHHRVPANQFTEYYNAAQLTTPLVLALAGNSPFFLGKRLWQETRIALFKQSIDYRDHATGRWRQPARVNFGNGWLRQGVAECLTESVALYPPILPVTAERMDESAQPFSELLLHHGTVWSWNRAVLQPGQKGHVRIEYRSLPAGPTIDDMLANAALQVGLVEALSGECETYLRRLPFRFAEHNFYRCAQYGLNARIIWPQLRQQGLSEQRVTDVIADLLPRADEGLASIGIDKTERDHYLNIIEHRLASRQTGASWQLSAFQRLSANLAPHHVLPELCRQYYQRSLDGQPVANWE